MPTITKRFVDAAKPKSNDTDAVYWEEGLRGFGLRVKRSGIQSYVIQYRNAQGHSRRYTLGHHGRLTPDVARKRAKLLLADVARGIDPADSGRRSATRSL